MGSLKLPPRVCGEMRVRRDPPARSWRSWRCAWCRVRPPLLNPSMMPAAPVFVPLPWVGEVVRSQTQGRKNRAKLKTWCAIPADVAKDDVGIFVSGALDDGAGFLHFRELQRSGTGDVDKDAASTIDCSGLEER